MKANTKQWIAALWLLLIQIGAYAVDGALFTVVSSGTPAVVDISLCLNARERLSCEKHKVTALDLLITPNIANQSYPNAGIYINTPGYTVASLGIACTLIDNGYCLFGVSSSSPKSLSLESTTAAKIPRFGYVGSFSAGTVSQCPINPDESLGACIQLDGPDNSSTNLFNQPLDITFNASGTLVYVANYLAGTIVKCDVNTTTGVFSGCSVQLDAYTTFTLRPESVSFNNAETFAYIGSYDSGIPMIVCQVNSGTGNLSACATTSQNFDYPMKTLFNAAGNYAYIGQWDNTGIYLCRVNSSTGMFDSCGLTPVSPVLAAPVGIAFNPNKSILYATNYNFSGTTPPPVSKCIVNLDHALTCTGTSDNAAVFSGPVAIAVNATGTFAYVTNYTTGLIAYCAIDGTGELVSCTNTGSGLSPSSMGMTLYY